jgi:hypothetical protein
MRHYTADAGLPPTLGNNLRRLLIEPFAAPFPPSTTDPRILMSDWSHFQGDNDIGKHLAYGPPKFRGVVIRSGQGKNSSYDDTKFIANVQMCEANNFPWMCYHVLIPTQTADAQVNHLSEIINRLGGVLPKWIWWDVQLHANQSKKHISDLNIDSILLTKQLIMPEVGTYSARWFTEGYMETQDWFSEEIWWIAQWYAADVRQEHPWPTALPDLVDISQVMIHQTTSHGDGKLVGIGSERIDLDRWMWTEEQFNEIMGLEEEPPNGDLKKQVEKNTQDIKQLTWEGAENKERIDIIEEWITSYDR